MKAPPDHDAMLAQILALQAEVARLSKRRTNKFGGSKDENRGAWCTKKKWADRLGPFDHDPFSNPRSHILSTTRCMLEDGGDGFGDGQLPGSFRCGLGPIQVATADTSTFIQPPYEIVMRAIAHYEHTRFCALLRFDPSTKWFLRLYRIVELIAVPVGERFNFEPPLGVKASSSTNPHAFYYRRAADAPREVLRNCIAWKVNRG